jgi:hypothetical protein
MAEGKLTDQRKLGAEPAPPEAKASHVPRSGSHYYSRGWSGAEPTDQRKIEPKPRSGETGAFTVAGGL